MIRFAVGLDVESGKAGGRDFLALLGIDPLESRKFGSRPVAHQELPGGERISRWGPSAGTYRRHDTFAQEERGNDKAKRQPGGNFLGEAVEHDARFRRQCSERRSVVEKAVNGILYDDEAEFVDHSQQVGTSR